MAHLCRNYAFTTPFSCVGFLIKLYQKIIRGQETGQNAKKKVNAVIIQMSIKILQ